MQSQRDSFASALYWTKQVAYLDKRMETLECERDDSRSNVVHRFMLLYQIFADGLERFIAHYSRGDDLSTLRALCPSILASLLQYLDNPQAEPVFLTEMSDYVSTLWLLSLSYLLCVDRHLVVGIAERLALRGQDAIIDTLLGAHDLLDQPPSSHLLHPRPYGYLLEAIQASGEERAAALARFLKTYYRSMRHCYWHDKHRHTDTGFFGYWCFELAAVVKLCRLADDAFADNSYYPRDLVGAC